MPLSILLPMVVLGIAGIAMLLHLLGLSRPARFDSIAEAKQAWQSEFPDDPARDAVLAHDHHAALIRTATGHGIVWPMGADSTARALTGARITQTRDGLRIDLPDFTAPHIRIHLDPDEAQDWPRLLETTS